MSSYRPFSASATTNRTQRNHELLSRERSWEGRAWISSHRQLLHTTDLPKIRIISYRLNADFKNIFLNYSSHKAWETKQQLLLAEITCYEADILCLQDIDHYEDFWFPVLSKLGYDVIYKQRTQDKDYHPEGILMAYSRDRFSLIKSVILELNQSSSSAGGISTVSSSSSTATDLSSRPITKNEEISSSFAEKCRTDDIAIILFIKSYYSNDLPCNGICIGNIMLDELTSNSDVRLFHCKYFIQKIEKENKDFQFPIILGMNTNDIPYSLPYVFMKTGRKPLTASIPSACSQGKLPLPCFSLFTLFVFHLMIMLLASVLPYCVSSPLSLLSFSLLVKALPISRSTALVKWKAPLITIADPTILYYRICWRPGGSTILSFKAQIEIPSGDCIKYIEVLDEVTQKKKIVQSTELEYMVTKLSAEIPYEFKVSAVNEMGIGEWSDPSSPIVLKNPERVSVTVLLNAFLRVTSCFSLIDGSHC
jgi:hypothetical protein